MDFNKLDLELAHNNQNEGPRNSFIEYATALIKRVLKKSAERKAVNLEQMAIYTSTNCSRYDYILLSVN